MKILIACTAVLASVLAPGSAGAQSNPFMPPQAGMSRDQIAQIVRQEIERSRASQPSTPTRQPGQPATGGAGANGGRATSQMPNGANSGALPNQPGPANPSTNASGQPGGAAPAAVADPVADLLKDGGIFVGCVGGTPVFKDRTGRRAYFTTRELRESNEARRFARCR